MLFCLQPARKTYLPATTTTLDFRFWILGLALHKPAGLKSTICLEDRSCGKSSISRYCTSSSHCHQHAAFTAFIVHHCHHVAMLPAHSRCHRYAVIMQPSPPSRGHYRHHASIATMRPLLPSSAPTPPT